jgi:hypothetical protein
MLFDQFVVRMIILLTPGTAGYFVYCQLRGSGPIRKRVKDWQDFLSILLFSIGGYSCTWVGAGLLDDLGHLFTHNPFASLRANMLNALLDQALKPSYLEIMITVALTVILGIVSAVAANRKWAFHFFNKINVTTSFGDDDVWSFIMNSDDYDWVIVRDHSQDLAYLAQISWFSDSGETRELVLEDVEVRRNSTWKLLYHTQSLYICRGEHDFSIELLPRQDKENTSAGENEGAK